MQISRLFEIVYILLNQKKITAGELAARFEVSRRTILRDIDVLSQAGVPIYTTPGKGGGISILEHYVLNKAVISETEQNQILFALQSVSAAEYAGTGEILSKLQSLFNKADTRWIEVDLSRWGNSAPDKQKFELLRTSILSKRAVSFTYLNSTGEIAERSAYPIKLVYKSKAWYLQAYCLLKEDYRTFKINRMLSIRALDQSFEQERLSPPPIESCGPSAPALTRVVMEFSRRAAYRMLDEFDAENIRENPDGTFTVTVDLPEDDWLYGLLLSHGGAVRVLEPRHIRESLCAMAEEIITQNSIR